MKTFIRFAASVTAAAVIGLMPLTSVTAKPTARPRGEVTFTFAFEAPAEGALTGVIEGVFAANALRDSGRATETYTLTPVSPTLIQAGGMKILEGRRGTMVMTFAAELHPQADGSLGGEAQWAIVAGSGAYQKIRGCGQGGVWMVFPADAAPSLAAEYTGSIYKDPRRE